MRLNLILLGLITCHVGACKFFQTSPVFYAKTPVKAVQVDADASEVLGVVEFDDEGLIRQRLEVSLDVIDAEEYSGKTPECREVIAETQILAELRCLDRELPARPLIAKHVYQFCRTLSSEPLSAASVAPSFPGCMRAELYGFRFRPPLLFEVLTIAESSYGN